ncbi:hypothetical protein [Nitrosomonas sp. Nm58]|jgi:hypothetical protein|uniref:hypothetical protein n=1 Tax=Nitrosomonas sp. Nm58 TaxID=200126 RepID=UPI00115FC719|nr:hypothetical protein [Nitrosomonas sp. Nm58]
MKPIDFQKWLAQSDMLTPSQRQRALIGQAASYNLIEERIADERKCPHRHTPGGMRHGMANGLQRCRCNHCGHTFNALKGTQTARLRKKEKWLDYAQSIKEDETIKKAAQRCIIHSSTASLLATPVSKRIRG